MPQNKTHPARCPESAACIQNFLMHPIFAHWIVTMGMLPQGSGAMIQVHQSIPSLTNPVLMLVFVTATVGKEIVIYGFYYPNHQNWCQGKTAWLSITQNPFTLSSNLFKRIANFNTSLAFSNACLYFMSITISSPLLGGKSPIKAYMLSAFALTSWAASLHMNAHSYNYLLDGGPKEIFLGFPSFNMIKQGKLSKFCESFLYMQLIEMLAYDIAMATLRGDNHPNKADFNQLTNTSDKNKLMEQIKILFDNNIEYEKIIIGIRTIYMILVFTIMSASMISFLTFPRAITQEIIRWRDTLQKHSPFFAQMIYYPALAVQFSLDPGGVIYCAHHKENTTCLAGSEKIENFFTLDNTIDKSILTKIIALIIVSMGMCYGLAMNCSNFSFKDQRYWQTDNLYRDYLVHKPKTLAFIYILSALIVLLGASANYLQTQAVLGSGAASTTLAITALLGPALMELEPMTQACLTLLEKIKPCQSNHTLTRKPQTDNPQEQIVAPLVQGQQGDSADKKLADLHRTLTDALSILRTEPPIQTNTLPEHPTEDEQGIQRTAA